MTPEWIAHSGFNRAYSEGAEIHSYRDLAGFFGRIEALRRVARPVTITTAALCAGLSALAFSELQNQVEFGALAAAILALAWLIDVVLTPALTSRLRIVTLWDVLTLDLGHDPRDSIPIFRGMSGRQARVVALMTRVRNFEPGHLLLRQGEAGDQIYALIDGEVEVSVATGGRRVSLGTLARGDVARIRARLNRLRDERGAAQCRAARAVGPPRERLGDDLAGVQANTDL